MLLFFAWLAAGAKIELLRKTNDKSFKFALRWVNFVRKGLFLPQQKKNIKMSAVNGNLDFSYILPFLTRPEKPYLMHFYFFFFFVFSSPLISADDISVISNSNSCKPMDNKFPGAEEEEEGGFYSQLISPDHYTELKTLPQSTPRKLPLPQIPKEASARSSSRDHQSESCSLLEPQAAGGYLTLTGTLRKGRKKPEECVYNIEMSLTRDHLSKIEKKVHAKYHDRCFCGLERGIHIFLLTLLCGPFLWILFTFQALYLGTLTWYNVFLHYNEERSCCHKLLSPLVLLIYPLWIIPVTLVLGLYGGLAQISWYYDSWIKVLRAPDGGFFGWVCNFLDTPECSPYQVILLSAQDYERPPTGATCL